MSNDIREETEQPANESNCAGNPTNSPAAENRRPAAPAVFPAAEGRDIAAILDPAPITVIGARRNDGRISFATVLWATPVSHNPAMLAFALRAKSHTMGLIRETGYFSISTFPADEESVRIIETCGNNSGHKLDKGKEVAYSLIEINADRAKNKGKIDAGSIALPVPNHALAWELCKVESIQEAGDHLLVISRVIRAASWGSRDKKGRLAPNETLLCIQHGAFAPVGNTI